MYITWLSVILEPCVPFSSAKLISIFPFPGDMLDAVAPVIVIGSS